MGNPMTPFIPPAPALVASIVSVACATISITGVTISLTNNVTRIIKLTASNGALDAGAVTVFSLPTTAPIDTYTIVGAYTGVTGNAYVSAGSGATGLIAPNITRTFWWGGTGFFNSGPLAGVTY